MTSRCPSSSRRILKNSPCAVIFVLVFGLTTASAAEPPPFPAVSTSKTASGVPFAILGEKPKAPAPTLIVLGGDMSGTLSREDGNRLGRWLIPKGYLCASLDLPAHGLDVLPGEQPGGLGGWKTRVENGENFAARFAQRFSQVLDHLVAEKYTDPSQVAISGTSRGGFAALHAAAGDARVKQVIAFAPVTFLPALTEFKGAEKNPLALSLDPIHLADKLAGKPMLIFIGNDDDRVSTEHCLAFALEVIRNSKGKLSPIPVELRIVGTIGHRLHASPTPEYGQLCAPHDEAFRWLIAQEPRSRK